MSINAILARLVELTAGVVGVGRIYDTSRRDVLEHVPEAQRAAVLRDVFGIDDQTAARGWSFRAYMWYRVGEPDMSRHGDLAGYVTHYDHEIAMQGYWEVNDAYASEREWRATTDAIRAQFENPLILNDVAKSFTFPRIQFEDRAVLNGLYTCHDVELRMLVHEVFDRSTYSSYVYPH